MRSFEELADFILKNSRHNTRRETKKVHIILDYPKLPWGDYYQYLMTLTWITGIEWDNGGSKACNLIFAKTLDAAVKESRDYDYAMISYVGTFYENYRTKETDTIHFYFDKFCNSQQACKGHILWHPNKQYGTLHLQSMFLNLKHWRIIGEPTFGRYSGRVMMPEISKSNVHDDYTPHWIKPSKNYVEVSEAPMAKYISRVLESGQTIFNYDMERKTKFFTYPERRKISMPLGREKKRDDNIIYAKNNDEIKDIKKYKGNKFDVIYAPASGFIAEYLYKEVGHDNTKLVIFDNHSYSLLWKKMIYNLANSEEDINKITQYFKEKYNCHIDNGKIKKNIVEQNEEIFSVTEWLTTIKTISNYEIIKYDVIKEQTFRIDKNKKNLIYLSNIFSYMFNYHKEKIEHLHKKFLEYAILPNSVIIGTNVFKDKIVAINDNIDKSSE